MNSFVHSRHGRLIALLGAWITGPAWAVGEPAHGGDFELTKVLIGGSGGASMTRGDYHLALALGEPAAGHAQTLESLALVSGYLGGRFGAAAGFRLLNARIGREDRRFFQNALQVGVARDAAIALDFSDGLEASSIAGGAFVLTAVDHQGHVRWSPGTVVHAYDPTARRVTIAPPSGWDGNTLYEIRVTPDLLSVDGFTHDGEARIRFLTLLDPAQDNLLLHPLGEDVLPPQGVLSASRTGNLRLRLPPGSLAQESFVLFNRDPVNAPVAVDPDVVREANRKAEAAGGPYRTPIQLHEINAYTAAGERISGLEKSGELFLSFSETGGLVEGLAAPVRVSSLSLWALDESHRLWVKLPGSRPGAARDSIGVSVPHFSVYALMGAASGSTADVHAFPVPWRPHGPRAGPGAGQTGTLEEGITFTNLPSECVIRIFTISGERVREMRHSDAGGGAIGQERWDVRTDGGEAVASGVYLWRVESPTDAKHGKLMVIR